MASGPSNKDDWQNCYYDIQGTITDGGVTTELHPSQITGLMIERDYDVDHLPVILISLSLQNDLNIHPDSSIQLRIDKCIGIEENGTITVTQKSSFINDSFSFVLLEDTPSSSYYENLIYGKKEKNEGDYLLQDASDSETFILVKRAIATASKVIMNCVLKKATLTQATNMLLSNAGVNNVLMANLDNTEEYEELIVLPLPLLESIIYLKNFYGFHKEDTTVFMDLDTTYIIRKDGGCTAFRDRETTNVDLCLNGYESMFDQCRGVIYNGNSTYVNIGSKDFKRLVGGTINDQTEGTNVMVYDEDKTATKTASTSNARAISNNTAVKSTLGHNKYVQEQIKCRKMEEQFVFSIGCTNADIGIFTPNKQFSIISNCSEISMDVSGTYRLSKHATTFAKTGKLFVPITTLTVKKAKG